MKQGRLLRRAAVLLLALVIFLPLTGPGVVLETSAVTQAEIDALKGSAGKLAPRHRRKGCV